MTLARYALVVIATVGLSLGFLVPTAFRSLDSRGRWAALYGASLATLNTITAYAVVLWSGRRSSAVFLRAVLGGMLARMLLLLAAVVAGILLLGLPKVPLAVSLLSYFVLFLIFEISQVQKMRTVS